MSERRSRAENRRRMETEILRLARQQLEEKGPADLSLREIARDMSVASSALYRYVRDVMSCSRSSSSMPTPTLLMLLTTPWVWTQKSGVAQKAPRTSERSRAPCAHGRSQTQRDGVSSTAPPFPATPRQPIKLSHRARVYSPVSRTSSLPATLSAPTPAAPMPRFSRAGWRTCSGLVTGAISTAWEQRQEKPAQ
ncbi:hypothetical protein COP05_07175 [Dermabacter jinjuensis]|uniref:HTH tetR-type domain-containing protein n=1 Tax=Dermabacter jinjuensis TaxID=1667168 RepID=A0ABM6PNH5_9MICO|nr:hypothetical protein COP05_07175 [Dermabacter jinjuensis]